MKKIALFGLILAAGAVAVVPASEAGGGRRHGFHHRPVFHSRVFIGVGPSYYWGPAYPYWYYPPPPYVVYSPPPVVVREDPPVYLQQPPPPPPAPAPSASSAEQFWYYCPSAGNYYPTVLSCPEVWVKVPPR